MKSQKLNRSRILILGGVLAAMLIFALRIWSDLAPRRAMVFELGFGASLLILLLGGLVTARGFAPWLGNPTQRLTRFGVGPRVFKIPIVNHIALNAMFTLVLYGFLAGPMVGQWFQRDDDLLLPMVTTILLVLYTVAVGFAVVLAWRAVRFELTPAGIHFQGPLLRRFIPWESLAQGGPFRPPLKPWTVGKLHLVVVRPDLVEQRGWSIGQGARQHPILPLMTTTHHWFIADAIRWYAEHPEDRAAIGTEAEHDRLSSTLVMGYPSPAPRRPRPLAVTVASRLSYTGAAWGLFYAGFLMFTAFAFQDRIRVAESAWAAEEERMTGDPVGPSLFGGADQMLMTAGIALGIAILAGVTGVLLARAAFRGAEGAREGLSGLSVLVVFQSIAGFCIPSPGMSLLGNDDSGGWQGALLLGGSLLNQAVTASLAIIVIVLLSQPVSVDYFRRVG